MMILPVMGDLPGIRDLDISCRTDDPTRIVEKYVDPWWTMEGPVRRMHDGLDLFEQQVCHRNTMSIRRLILPRLEVGHLDCSASQQQNASFLILRRQI